MGILTHKSAAEFAQQVFGKNAVVGWFGRDDRATNAFYEAGVQVLVAVGLPHRNIGSVAAERLKAGTKQRALRKARLDPQGNWWTILREFADPELATAVRREVAVAYLQAAGRLRQGRRSEPCYMVVLDAEPLPEALNPAVIPPEKVLPPEVWQDWQRRRQRGVAVANALRQKAAAERLAKAMEAVALYRRIIGSDPQGSWLAKAIGVPLRTAWRLLGQVRQTVPHISEKGRENEDTPELAQMYGTDCLTLEDAIRAFLKAGYPVPVRSFARKFGVSKSKVSRLARRLATKPPSTDQPATISTEDWLASFSTPDLPTLFKPFCPECSEPLEPEPDRPADDREDLWIWFLTDPEYRKPTRPASNPKAAENPEPEPTYALPAATTLNEAICPYCGIELEPEPDSGLAACVGCGRLFKVEALKPDSPFCIKDAWRPNPPQP
jgi:hypothetical protein